MIKRYKESGNELSREVRRNSCLMFEDSGN